MIDSESPIGISINALKNTAARMGGLPQALNHFADIVDVGDGGVDHEGCIVPDLRFYADLLANGTINEQTFWQMLGVQDP